MDLVAFACLSSIQFPRLLPQFSEAVVYWVSTPTLIEVCYPFKEVYLGTVIHVSAFDIGGVVHFRNVSIIKMNSQ